MRPNYDVRQVYNGDGIQATFTFDFKVVDLEHLLVLHVDSITEEVYFAVRATDTTYFSTTLNGEEGGSIEFVTEPETGTKVIILLADDNPTQPSKYVADDRYTLRRIENSLDTLSGQIQRMRYLLDRSIKLPEKFTAAFLSEMDNIIAESVPVINATRDGIVMTPRSAFKGDPGDNGISPQFYYQDEEPTTPNSNDVWINSMTSEISKFVSGNWVSLGFLSGASPDDEAFTLLETYEHDTDDFRTRWTAPLVWQGFSTRFNQMVDIEGINALGNFLIQLGYTPPNISLTSNVSNANRERGNAITSMTLTAGLTRTLEDLAEVRFYQNPSTLLDTQNSGGGIPSGGNSTYAWTGSFSNTTTFRAEVDDVSGEAKPSRTATLTYSFFFPYFSGKGGAGVTPSDIYSTFNKTIASTPASVAVAFSFAIGEKPYFAYPASFADLTSIKNVNNLETIGSWTKRTENMTNAFGETTSYKIYEFNNLAGEANNNTYTFIR